MSYYYQYNFISPEGIFSTVQEELKSYFDTGMIDSLLFPTYVDKCLRKLGKTGYDIHEVILDIEDYQARLPDNFISVREAWMCTTIDSIPYVQPNSFYSQAVSQETIQLNPVISGGKPCSNIGCNNPGCNGSECMPTLIQAVYKTTNGTSFSYKRSFLLKPGNISTRKDCAVDCANFGSNATDSFDIRDNKFVTNFRNGTVHLIFYATEYDKEGNQLIPGNYRVMEYIEAFLKYKMFETISNQIADETFNQVQSKMMYYKQLSDEAYILADTEIKKQTAYQKQRAIERNLNRFNMYELPNRRNWG